MMIKKIINLFMKKLFKKQVSMEVLFEKWLNMKTSEGRVKAVTLQNYKRQISLHISPVLGHCNVSIVDKELIQNFVDSLIKEKKLKATTVRNIFGRLSEIMNYAVREDMINTNPCSAVRLPQGKNKAGKALSLEEQMSIEELLKSQSTPHKIAVQLALHSGLRISEITALRWKDIDFEKGFIYVQHSFKRISIDGKGQKTFLHLGTPKSKNSVRSVPMTAQIKICLEKYYKTLNFLQNKDESFVVCKKNGNFYDVRAIQRYFSKLCQIAGIAQYHFHDLRHTFATNAKESGIDIQLISEILGHAHTTTTMNIYLHPSDNYKKEEIKKMDGRSKKEHLKAKNTIEKIYLKAI